MLLESLNIPLSSYLCGKLNVALFRVQFNSNVFYSVNVYHPAYQYMWLSSTPECLCVYTLQIFTLVLYDTE